MFLSPGLLVASLFFLEEQTSCSVDAAPALEPAGPCPELCLLPADKSPRLPELQVRPMLKWANYTRLMALL